MIGQDLLGKAERALEAANRALAASDSETAADRAYYAAYYAAWAMLESAGVTRPKTHSGLIAEFSHNFVKTGTVESARGAVLSRLQNLRMVADYTLDAIPAADAQRAVSEAAAFIEAARPLIDRR